MISDSVPPRIPRQKRPFTRFLPPLLGLLFFAIFLLEIFFPPLEGILTGYIIYILIGFLVLAFLSFWLSNRFWHNNWRELADQSGLQYESYRPNFFTIIPWARLSGTYLSNLTKVERFDRGMGRYKKTYTRITLQLRTSLDGTLEIRPAGLMARFQRSIDQRGESQNLAALDEEVSRKLSIKATNQRWISSILSQHRLRQGLLELAPQAREMEITVMGQELSYQERGSITDMVYMRAVLDLFVDLVGTIERA